MRALLHNHRHLLSGSAAGVTATLVFAALHHLLISDIWWSLGPMLVAGILCGISVAWSYGRLFRPPSVGSWLRYNLSYVVVLVLLGVASVVAFEPITSIPALLAANEPPRALIRQALPLTMAFIVASAAFMWWLWGKSLLDAAALLLSCFVLVVFLGLNVSVLGLVELRGGTASVFVFFALIMALNAIYLSSFLMLERRRFAGYNQGIVPIEDAS